MVHHRTPSSPGRQSLATTGVTRGDHIVVLCVAGEVDGDSAPPIYRAARRVCWSVPPTLLVDLTGVTFFGAAGLTLLTDIHRQARVAGTVLYLVAPPRIVHLLRITGLNRTFPTHDTVSHTKAAARQNLAGLTARPAAPPALNSDVDTYEGLLR